MMEPRNPDEGRVALALISRLLIHLTVEENLTKETMIGLLRDVMKEFDAPQCLPEYRLVRSLAVEIDDGVRDGPDYP